MKLQKLVISNCKSYLIKREIEFENDFNILIGPNGGGKSNTLDIITVILRHLMHACTIVDNNDGKKINSQYSFRNIKHDLDTFFGHEKEEQVIEVYFIIQENDVYNMRTIKERLDDFEVVKNKYTSLPLGNFTQIEAWDLTNLKANSLVKYTFKKGVVNSSEGENAEIFKQYLQYLELFIILSNDVENLNLRSNFIFFSPYRGGGIKELQANLSGQNYYNLLVNYYTSTSKDVTSLINLATLYFASKKRKYEYEAAEKGYSNEWENDEEVRLVSKYMNRLGYEWSLNLIDPEKNIYEIRLKKADKEFNITQASSGEKEIFNFLLGIFAFQIKGGIIVVDEPELHLHPKWQNVLRDLFIELSETTNNQFIITTHSPTFITSNTLPNIRRLSKSNIGETVVHKTGEGNLEDRKSLLHIVNSHNNERMFFADHVVLVEGIQDRLVFKKFIDHQLDRDKEQKIVEVLEVYGKNNFDSYKNFLKGFGVKVSIIADRDYLFDLKKKDINDLLKTDFGKIDDSILKSKKSKDASTLIELLKTYIKEDDKEGVAEFINHLEGRKTNIREDLKDEDITRIYGLIEGLYKEGVYILKKGEIENYLPEGYTSLGNTIKLIDDTEFEKWISNEKVKSFICELQDIAKRILADNGHLTSPAASKEKSTVSEKAVTKTISAEKD